MRILIDDYDKSSAPARLRLVELNKANEVRAILHDPIGTEDNRAVFKNNRLSHKLNKLMLELCAMWYHVDLLAVGESREEAIKRQTARFKTLKLRLFNRQLNICLPSLPQCTKSSEWRLRARKKLWPYLLTLVWISCTIHLGYYLYHQYAYDYYLFRLSRVRWLNQTQELRSYKLECEDYLLGRLSQLGDDLKRLGAPMVHMSFAIQCIYMALSWGPLGFYLLMSVYFNWSEPFNFYFIRNFFDFAREQRHNERFVRSHVQKLTRSIENWSRSLMAAGFQTRDGKLLSPGRTGLIDCATIGGSHLCGQLNEMLAAGQLRPLNQRPNWVRLSSRHFFWVMSVMWSYCVNADTVLISLLIIYLDKSPGELGANEWLSLCELVFLFIINNTLSTIYGTIMVFTCWDQVRLVNKLRRLLATTIELNQLRIEAHKQSDGAGAYKQPLGQQMNRNILLVLMHYRLFVSQYVELKRSVSIIATASVYVMFFTPLACRLHVPYFQANTMQIMRLIVVMASLMTVIYADIYLVPVCYLNKRCIDLYRELNSLLAHAISLEIDQNYYQDESQTIQDRKFIISLLRKELAHHDQVTRQLAIQYFGLKFTFGNVVRLHFYAGFIILSIMGENVAYLKEPNGSILTDPLGLF